jgi:hypothetical protein
MVDLIRHHAIENNAVIATGFVTNVLIFISVLSAYPWVRKLVYQFLYVGYVNK